jgi:hypothetical protein
MSSGLYIPLDDPFKKEIYTINAELHTQFKLELCICPFYSNAHIYMGMDR